MREGGDTGTPEERRAQVVDQCRAVAHLAKALFEIHDDYSRLMASSPHAEHIEQVGKRTAAWMEKLGDMLNGIDAVTEEDDWLKPIFEKAHAMFPTLSKPTESTRD